MSRPGCLSVCLSVEGRGAGLQAADHPAGVCWCLASAPLGELPCSLGHVLGSVSTVACLSIHSGLRAFGLFPFWVTVSRVLWAFPCLGGHELSFHLFSPPPLLSPLSPPQEEPVLNFPWFFPEECRASANAPRHHPHRAEGTGCLQETGS